MQNIETPTKIVPPEAISKGAQREQQLIRAITAAEEAGAPAWKLKHLRQQLKNLEQYNRLTAERDRSVRAVAKQIQAERQQERNKRTLQGIADYWGVK